VIVDCKLELPEGADIDESKAISLVLSDSEGCPSRIVIACVATITTVGGTIETKVVRLYTSKRWTGAY
jgi:hypothetical protein